MRADLSRGHRPDDKRGQRYRRVLTQQGRLWLDSDVAASVDATDRLLRHIAKDVGCPAGSPDTGFLTSPGRPFAWFDSVDHVSGLPAQGALFRAYRDYAVKYLERFPSLYLDARAATQNLTIRARHSFQVANVGKLRLWVKLAPGASPLAVTVNGENVPAPAPVTGNFGFDAYDYDLAAANVSPQTYSEIVVGFSAIGASNEAWIGFMEAFEPAQLNPKFWVTDGRYYVDGLEVEWGADESSATFLKPYAPLAAGTRFVAYLEAWERVVTHVEDPGLRDSALAGLDTTVRTRPVGQVKLATLQGAAPPLGELVGVVERAVHAVDLGGGRLDGTPAAAPPNPDPCAIPAQGGYNADENRLYRFEVHVGGNLATASIKWSRNNGSELYGVLAVTDPAQGLVNLQATPGTAPPMRLVENDLVEIVTEDIDLGDDQRATVILGASPSVVPARRRVGRLCLVKTTNADDVVQLCDFTTKAPIDFTAVNAPPQPVRLRKWDGLIQSTAAPSVHTIEDGLDVELSGSDFRALDYWQFEARRLGNNAASPWQIERHGPERLLAPLALFQVGANGTVPVELQHWFDDRFRPICELRADDIWYDGAKSETDADTVQEAIDELYVLVEKGGGCCDFTLTAPTNPAADDTARLQALVDQVEGRGKICLERGVYHLSGKIVVDKKHVTIEGCPEAIILATATSGPVFELVEMAGLSLENVALRATGTFPIISARTTPFASESPQNAITVRLREAWLLHVGTGAIISDGAVQVPAFALNTDSPWQVAAPTTDNLLRVHAEDSVLCGDAGVVANRSALVELVNTAVSAKRLGLMSSWSWGARFVLTDARVTCDFIESSRQVLLGADAEDLVSVASTLLEASIGFVQGSVALAAQGITVEVVRSRVGGDAGILGDCTILADDSAISGNAASAVFASNLALTATETSFFSQGIAIHGLTPNQLALTRCQFLARVGVALGIGADEQSIYSMFADEIRVTGCRFELTGSNQDRPAGGVLIGGYPMDLMKPPTPLPVNVLGIEIVDNLFAFSIVRERSFGISVAIRHFEETDPRRTAKHRIEGNTILGFAEFGVCARGKNFRIVNNDLPVTAGTPAKPLKQLAAVALYGGANSVITDNTVRLRGTQATKDVIGVFLFGSVEESGPGIVVRNNAVALAPENQSLARPLVVGAPAGAPPYDRLVVENNELEGSEVLLVRTTNATVRANRFSVDRVRMPAAVSGTFQENRVRRGDNGRVDLVELSGSWLVDHNECVTLYVVPNAHWMFVLDDTLTTFPLMTMAMLEASARPSSDTVERNLRGAFRGLRDTGAPAGLDLEPGEDDAVRAGVLARDLAIEVGEILDELVEEVALLRVWREVAYRAHVADNVVSGSLVVGNPPQPGPFEGGPVAPNGSSWVQVLGNQVGDTLSVNQYTHLIVAHNMAGNLLPAPLGGTTSTVVAHNHNA